MLAAVKYIVSVTTIEHVIATPSRKAVRTAQSGEGVVFIGADDYIVA
jgi:hypothetical protein